MPTNRPFFPNLRPVKKVVTPQGEVLTHISEMKSFQRACGAIFHQYLCGSKRSEDSSEVNTPWVRNKISPCSSCSMLP
jgi:hypothetical protein